jgi:hypothetical protein
LSSDGSCDERIFTDFSHALSAFTSLQGPVDHRLPISDKRRAMSSPYFESSADFSRSSQGSCRLSSGRFAFTLSNIASDFRDRYLQFYFAAHSGTHKLKIFSLLFGVAGISILLLDRKLRATVLSRFLMLSACLAYLGVALLDDLKYPHYFVYVTPILSACGAVWLYDSFQGRSFSRWIGSGLFLAFCLANVAGCAYYIHRNDFANEYKPVVAKVESLLGADDIVMGPSELGFALGFRPPLIDDCTLGFTPESNQGSMFFILPAAFRVTPVLFGTGRAKDLLPTITQCWNAEGTPCICETLLRVCNFVSSTR